VEAHKLLADTAYGGDDNTQYAASKGIELVSPVAGKKMDGHSADSSETTDTEEIEDFSDTTLTKGITLADFEKDENDVITSCPMGQVPETKENKKGNSLRAIFNCALCMACSCQGECPVKIKKNRATISYTTKVLRLSQRRKEQNSPRFKKLYRMRSGIEATDSQLARQLGIKRLRVKISTIWKPRYN
jgi:hypothetical protein